MDGRPLVAQLRAAHVLTAASLLAACFLVPTVQAAYGPNGLTISGIGAASYAGPAVVADAQGGYFVAWHDSVSGSGGDIRLQHVSAVGTPLASNLAITNDASALSAPVMTSDGAGGVVLAWIGGTNWVFAQHVSANNSALWTANGVRVTTDNHDELRPAIAGDGSGGAVVAWEDHRGSKASIFVQDMTSLSGGRSWGDASVAMDTSATDDRLAPRIAADGAGGAVLCWDDFDGSAYHTTVRRVLAGGAVTWPAPIVVGGSNERKALLACDGSANTFVAWNKPSTGTSGLYVEKLDGNGGTVWSGARVDGAAAGLAPYGLWPESGGGLLLLYSDLTLLRAQELSSSGTPQPLALSLQPSQPITGVGGATDGGTGIFASWTQNDGQAYARHVVSVSGGLRTPLRTMTTIASTSRQLPSAQMLTSGDFVAAWSDVAVDTTIVAQRMSPAGTMGDYHHVTTDVTGAGRITSAASAVDSLNGVFYAATGSSVTFRARSTSGGTYLDSLFVDAEFFGPAPNYTFTAISADSALRASFSSQPYAQTIVTRAFQYVPVGFPMTPNPSSPVTLFASIGTEGSGTWRLGRWNPVVPHYVEPPDSLTAIAAGAGYWLGTAKPETLTVSGAPVAEADFVLPLAPAAAADSGWNQIADPFRFPVAVADLYVGAGGAPVALTSGGNTLTDPMVLSAATSGSPVAVSVMHPDTAYWIWRRPGNGNVKLTFPYTFDASADLTAPLSPPASAWSIGLDVRGASQDASHLEVGAAGAAPGADRALTARATPLAPGAPLALASLQGGDAYARDFRVDGATLQWTVRVTGAASLGEASLAFAFRNVPAGRSVTLSDPAEGWTRTIADGANVPLVLGATPRDLQLIVSGTAPPPAAGGPSALRAAAPNPFHDGVALSFWLPAGGALELDVYDLAGRRVMQASRAALAPGEHVVAWDGRDAGGARVAPGVYLARWRAADRSGVTRLVSLR